MHPIAGTIMIEDESGQLRFLARKTTKLFVSTYHYEEKTAMSAILDKIKEIVNLDFDKLELVELTNSHWNDQNIPLYLFSYNGPADDDLFFQLDDSDRYAWMNHRDLRQTFLELNIEGVPSFIEK